MTFWDHLDELRKVLYRSAIFLVVFMLVFFSLKDILFDYIIFAPTSSDFILYRGMDKVLQWLHLPALEPFSIKLINIELSAQFFIHISTSFYFGLVCATPIILYFLWGFVSPALYPNEIRAVKKAFGLSGFLFFIGVLVGYFLVFPLTLRFLGTYQVSESVVNEISLQSYISMFVWLILIMGVVFELPCLALLLSKFGIITKSLLKKYRKHAFVVILVLAAFITPSGDPFTLFAVAMPIYFLYEVSILLCSDKKNNEADGDFAESDSANDSSADDDSVDDTIDYNGDNASVGEDVNEVTGNGSLDVVVNEAETDNVQTTDASLASGNEIDDDIVGKRSDTKDGIQGGER